MRREKVAKDNKKCCHTAVICICYRKYVAEMMVIAEVT